MRTRTAAALLSLALASAGHAQWTLVASNGPRSRSGHALTIDTLRGRVTMFGGNGSGPMSDTWDWNGTVWTQRSTGVIPARQQMSAALEPLSSGFLIYGGNDSNAASPIFNETWVLIGNSWQRRGTPLSPPRVYDYAIAADLARGNIVLFGGFSSQNAPGDAKAETWLYKNGQWSRGPVGGPIARAEFRKRVVLFGGTTGGVALNDTWEWDGVSWSPVPAPGPSRRSHATLAYHGRARTLVLFGGKEISGNRLNDTWTWNGTNWVPLNLTPAPSPRWGHAMTQTVNRQGVLLWGGYPSGQETWELRDLPLAAWGPPISVGACAASTSIRVAVSPSSLTPAIGSVRVNANAIGGPSLLSLSDLGTTGDGAAGDRLYAASINLSSAVTPGQYQLPFTVTDGVGRTVSGTIPVTVLPSGTCGAMDVALVVDVSGSVSPAIPAIKSALTNTINAIDCASGGDYQLGLVTFNGGVCVKVPLGQGGSPAANRTAVLSAINNAQFTQCAGPNTRVEELSADAVSAAINNSAAGNCPTCGPCQTGNFTSPWRANAQKSIILITDNIASTCNNQALPTSVAAALAEQAFRKGIRITTVYVLTGSADANVRTYLFHYAFGTGGRYIEATATNPAISDGLKASMQNCGG